MSRHRRDPAQDFSWARPENLVKERRLTVRRDDLKVSVAPEMQTSIACRIAKADMRLQRSGKNDPISSRPKAMPIETNVPGMQLCCDNFKSPTALMIC